MTNLHSCGIIRNHTDAPMTVYLEMMGEEVQVKPGEQFELLIQNDGSALPITIWAVKDGLQIHPNRSTGEWWIRVNGKLIKPDWPTVLSELKAQDGH